MRRGQDRTRIGVGVLVALVTLGFLLAAPALAQADGDVEVEIVDFDVEEAAVGEGITIEAEVTNDRSDAEDFEIALEINGSEVQSSPTGRLDPGETTTVDFEYTVEQEDAPEFGLAVVSDDDRDERTVSVTEEPRFGLEFAAAPPDFVVAGEDIDLTAEIENTGADADPADVTFRVGGELKETQLVEPTREDPERVNFSYSTDRRDLGDLDIGVEIDGKTLEETVTVTLPDGVPFAAERTTVRGITVTLDSAEVGENQTVSEDNLTLRVEGIEWSDSEKGTWDLGDCVDGPCQKEMAVPREIPEDESLINTTIEVGETGLSDTVDLHTVEQTTIAGWAGDGSVYVPVDTVGIPDVDEADVSVSLSGGGSFDADFEDPTTVAIDLDEFREETDSETDAELTFETDDAPIGPINGLGPDIRYLHGEVVLWHPHIETGTEYTVTLEDINGQDLDRSTNETASGPGTVPVPNPGQVAGADNVTLRIAETGSDEPLFEGLEVAAISEEHTMNATVTDSQTLEGDRSLERLSVSAVLIETEANSTAETIYLTGEEFEVDGDQLSVSGVDLDTGHTVQAATNAGIVTVNLEPGEDSPVPGFLFPAVLLVLTSLGGLIGGVVVGRRTGTPNLDRIETVSVGIIALITIGLFAVHLLRPLPLPGDPRRHHLGVFLLFGALAVGYALGGVLLHRSADEYGQSGTRTNKQRQTTVTKQISITDGSRPIRERVEIEARKDDNPPKTRSSIVSAGSGTVTFPTGTWTLQAELETDGGTYTSDPVREEFSRRGGRSNVTLEIPLPDVSVSVRDPAHDRPVPGASVQMVTDSETETKRTGSDGGVTFDPPLDSDSIALTADHEKYEETTTERTIGDGAISETVELRPRTGRLEIVSRIDGVEVGGMEISIDPDESALEEIYGGDATIETTTEANGSFAREDFIVGRYRVALDLPERFDSHFETSDARASVRRSGDTVSLEARFTWDLSREQRDRVGRIRGELDDVASKSGIDTAIPQYYASVVETVLDAVESFPEQGHHFAELDVHPDELTDATLEAAADTVETISEAMSTKRNLDLFTACADMADVRVRWGGTFDIDSLAERVRDDPMAARRAFAERADRTSKRIDTERSDFSEIAPARELLERIEIDDSKRGVDSVVSIHVAILLLDAIEELFEHRELRERLSRTVF